MNCSSHFNDTSNKTMPPRPICHNINSQKNKLTNLQQKNYEGPQIRSNIVTNNVGRSHNLESNVILDSNPGKVDDLENDYRMSSSSHSQKKYQSHQNN